ncbi:MAG: ATP-binding protein [Planctomycetes bacterium]|nr:ATP-binding protein [Planctomycetota bacterium]
MFTRLLHLPDHSFFLFGPRGTGKTTWLRQVLPNALWFDLLRTQTFLALTRQPDSFRQQIQAWPEGSWIVVDEVQRLPSLLNEVHALIAERGHAYRFALSGSSARKLKRMDVNLLAGRVINRQFFPLTGTELNYDIDLDQVLRFGLLPQIHAEPNFALDALEAYVANYIREEIQQEALVRNLDSFSRFLEVAALMNGQIANVSGLARDCAVARPTVQGYFATLVGTLIGFWLPAWRKRAKVKEVASPKFYLFDPGVVRALAGRLREPLDPVERGFLLETWLLHELRAAMACQDTGGQLHYWRTPGGTEVDFIWTRAEHAVGLEIKAATTWRSEYGAALKSLLAQGSLEAAYGIYLGTAELKDGALRVFPLRRFLRELASGNVLRTVEE